MKRFNHDPLLRDIARKFLTLPPFPDADLDRALALKTYKHVAAFPVEEGTGPNIFGVRYYIAGKTRFFAYARPDQLDDAIRFADACTLRFWKYRTRGTASMDARQLNYGMDATAADLAEWLTLRPDILALIDEIEAHLLDVEVFKAPQSSDIRQPPQFNRKTIKGELQFLNWQMLDLHQELVEMMQKVLNEKPAPGSK